MGRRRGRGVRGIRWTTIYRMRDREERGEGREEEGRGGSDGKEKREGSERDKMDHNIQNEG